MKSRINSTEPKSKPKKISIVMHRAARSLDADKIIKLITKHANEPDYLLRKTRDGRTALDVFREYNFWHGWRNEINKPKWGQLMTYVIATYGIDFVIKDRNAMYWLLANLSELQNRNIALELLKSHRSFLHLPIDLYSGDDARNGFSSKIEYILRYAFEHEDEVLLAELFRLDDINNYINKKYFGLNSAEKHIATPLLITAATIKNSKFLRALLSIPTIDVNIAKSNGDTALIVAIRHNNPEAVQLLLKHPSIDTTLRGDKQEPSPLGFAASLGYLEIVKEFIKAHQHRSVDLFAWAAECGHHDIINDLVMQSDFNPSAEISKGNTSLHVAVRHNMTAVVKTFLAHPLINLEIPDGKNLTALEIAINNKQGEIIDMLVTASKQSSNDLMVWASMKRNRYPLCATLMQRPEFDPGMTLPNGENVLILLVRMSYTQLAEHLLQRSDMNLHFQDRRGKTVLIYAAELGFTDLVGKLLAYDSSCVNMRDNDGNTAMILAAKNHDDAIMIDHLFDYGADASLLNSLHLSAYDEAEIAAHKGIRGRLKHPPIIKRPPAHNPYNHAIITAPPDNAAQPSAPQLEDVDDTTQCGNQFRLFGKSCSNPHLVDTTKTPASDEMETKMTLGYHAT